MSFRLPITFTAALIFSASSCIHASTLFFGASILTLAPKSEPIAKGWILVDDDGYIVEIGEGSPSQEILSKAVMKEDLSNRILIPGFLSGHSHLWQSAFRGIAPDGELYPWLDALHRTYGDDLVSGDLAAFTAQGALDQLRHGVTTTYNHTHWLDHDFTLYREQFDAEAELPQRFIFSQCLPLDKDADTWAEQLSLFLPSDSPSPTRNLLAVSINVRPFGPAEKVRAQVDFAKANGLAFQLHYLEQSSRQESDRASWPKYLDTGIVSEQATFAHFIHPSEEILTDAARAGAGMIWNPLSNGRLGSGLANIPHYLNTGLKVGMGVDGQASADISDPFENMRMGLYATRMREENADGLQPIDILRLHTLDTAKILNVDSYVGSLEEGKFADFIVVDPNHPATGPIWDLAAHLVFTCDSSNIDSIYIGGKKVVEQGHVIGHDMDSLSADVSTRIANLRARHNTPSSKAN